MFCNSYDGCVSVRSGRSNGRSFWESLQDGKVTITGRDDQNAVFKRTVIVKGGEIWDNKITKDGKPVYHIVYGEFEKLGKTIVHFKKGTGKGKHGKARRVESLCGHWGVCHSEYKNGALVRQKFIYDNGRLAYDYNPRKPQCIIKDYDGNVMYEVTGLLCGRLDNAMNESHTVFAKDMKGWFSVSKPFEVKRKGKVIYKGQYSQGQEEYGYTQHQKVGEWVEDGVRSTYVNGVCIPNRIKGKPADKLTLPEILALDNAQLRMALMSKFEPEAIAKCGRVVHKEGDMRLYDIKNVDVRILRVRCTTTKAYYYLRVPKDSKKCEQARQWTFGVGEYLKEPIKFEVET